MVASTSKDANRQQCEQLCTHFCHSQQGLCFESTAGTALKGTRVCRLCSLGTGIRGAWDTGAM